MSSSNDPTWMRTDHVRRLRERSRFDVVVIGGGVTGAGAALDLAVRGLEVALVEQSDFAQGTSSRSTKLLHGGIRYLPHFEFTLVSEGLREQKVLARIADFLFEPLEFVVPVYAQYGLADAPSWAARGWKAPLALRAGLVLYDVLGGFGRPGRWHRKIDTDSVATLVPTLRREGLTNAFVYSDAETDDARLVVSVLKTAVRRYGTTAISLIRADAIHPLDRGFRVSLTDLLTGDEFSIVARTVLAATGAFPPPELDPSQPGGGERLAGPGGWPPDLNVVLSKGTHLIVDRGTLGLGDTAVVLPETDDGRVLFVVPWLGHSMIGTTDTPYDGDPANPTPTDEDVAYLVRHVRRYLDVPEFEPISSFAGLRALKDMEGKATSRVSRDHVIKEVVPGYVLVAGGKLTTYRRIAAEAADKVAEGLGLTVKSSTDAVPLIGAGYARPHLEAMLRSAGVHESAIGPTVARYGGETVAVARLVEARPALATPLSDGRSTLADVVYAIRHEAAVKMSDITLRRAHLAWFTRDHARSDAARIGEVMASELGWSEDEMAEAIANHEADLAAAAL